MEERVQKLLSAAGVCSPADGGDLYRSREGEYQRRDAQLGQRADPDRDDIRLTVTPLGRRQPVYLLLNKPGAMSRPFRTRRDANRGGSGGGLRRPGLSRGRLDLDSEGLLLLTNDGALMQYLLHPRHGIDKTYHVTVFGDIRDAAVRLAAVTDLEGSPSAPLR